jgi:hypothetical protein
MGALSFCARCAPFHARVILDATALSRALSHLAGPSHARRSPISRKSRTPVQHDGASQCTSMMRGSGACTDVDHCAASAVACLTFLSCRTKYLQLLQCNVRCGSNVIHMSSLSTGKGQRMKKCLIVERLEAINMSEPDRRRALYALQTGNSIAEGILKLVRIGKSLRGTMHHPTMVPKH